MWKVLLAIFFIAGFAIEISFIMAPVTLGLMGFWPSVISFILLWIFMIVTGLLYFEALLASPPGTNIASLSSRLIGPFGTWLGSTTGIILNYSYLMTYFALGPSILGTLLANYFEVPDLQYWYTIWIIVIFGGIVFLSTSLSFLINFILMVLFFIPFVAIVILGLLDLSAPFLNHTYLLYMFFGIPVIFDAFFYQTILPVVTNFLGRDLRKMKIALWSGLTLTLIVFLLWSLVTIGSNAYDTFLEAFSSGRTQEAGYLFLARIPVYGKWILPMTLCSTLAAFLVTGVSFVDFFGDLFKISLKHRKHGMIRGLLCLLVIVPGILLNFLPAKLANIINLVTEFGELFLGGIFPVWWVWNARYKLGVSRVPLLGGGKVALLLISISIFFLFYFIGINIIYQMEWSTIPA